MVLAMTRSTADLWNQENSPPMADELEDDIEFFKDRAGAASDFMKALAHESRLLLLCLVAERERSVTELENILSLRQPAVSQQLARLRTDGLVTTRREGKVIYYRLASEEVRRIMGVLYEIFCRKDAGSNADVIAKRFDTLPKS